MYVCTCDGHGSIIQQLKRIKVISDNPTGFQINMQLLMNQLN